MTDTFSEHAIVEMLGHRRVAGLLTEVQIAGAGFLRLDIPTTPPMTQIISPASIYAITPTTEEVTRRMMAERDLAPVRRWELAAAEPEPTPGDADYWVDGEG